MLLHKISKSVCRLGCCGRAELTMTVEPELAACTQELSAVVPDTIPTKVVASAERKYAAWIGGSMLSSLSTYRNILISKQDFEEHGGNIANRKCL